MTFASMPYEVVKIKFHFVKIRVSVLRIYAVCGTITVGIFCDFTEECLMKRRIVSLTVALAMVFSMTGAFSLSARAEGFEGSGGTGEVSSPYIIANLKDLEELSTYAATNDTTGKYFELTADIDMSDTYGADKGDEGGKSWTPIGDVFSSKPFKGTFDGKGHTIKGLYIGDSLYGGLFEGIGEGGTVKNLSVSGSIDGGTVDIGGIAGLNSGTIENCYSDVDINGSCSIGGIAGLNDKGTIKGCYNTGNITSSTSDGFSGTGGIAGDNNGEGGGGTIQNCHNAGSVTLTADGDSPTGGIAGNNSQGKIENCYNTGEIITSSGTESFTGGIAGKNTAAIENSYNTATISGYKATGGIAGSNDQNSADTGSIKNSYNLGNITSTSDAAGGIAGKNTVAIENSYNTAKISGTTATGGIAGTNSDKIQNCYNTGEISGSTNAGGIAGTNSNGTIANCYYLKDMAQKGIGGTDKDTPGTVDVKNADDFKKLASSLNGDSGSAWEDSSFLKRPILTAAPEGGNGKEATPYTIPDKPTLEKIRNYINDDDDGGSGEHFKLTADINLDGSDGEQWTPIGIYEPATFPELVSTEKPFQGTFDGDGHKISGLYIKTSNESKGLFGYIGTTGTVKNLGVEGSVTAYNYSGGIAGKNEGTITYCYSGVNLVGKGNVGYGGVAGQNKGKIENCYNTGSISGGNFVGGIAGYCDGGTIENCYNTNGNITATASVSYFGAITGQLQNNSTVKNCYYLGTDGLKGVGFTSTSGTNTVEKTESKTEDEFNSGAVTWLLQKGQTSPDTQVWGQKLGDGADDYPVLTSAAGAKVLKVAFIQNETEYDAKYTNPNGKVALPSEPKRNNYTFKNWSKTQGDGEKFDENTSVTEDMTVYAVGRDHFGGDSNITLNDTYGYKEPITADLNEYMAYANKSVEAEGKFTYEISDQGDTDASINENTLTVQPGLNAGEHTITITAHEKTPQYSLMSFDSYGTDDVTLTVKVSIAKAEPSVTVKAADLTYDGNEHELVTGETEDGTLKYATSQDGVYSETVPKGTDAQDYEVWYKVEGDSNHKDIDPTKVEDVKIKKAASSVESAPTAKDLTYTGEAQELVTAGKTEDGEVQYATQQEGNYTNVIPTGTEAKDYDVWYKVKGDSNHEDSTPQKVENVKINKADSTLAVDGGEVTYGSTITLTANVTRSAANGIRLAAVALDKVEFFINEKSLGTANVEYTDGELKSIGTATLEITANKDFEIGENTIRAEYGGSVNLNGSQNNEITVTMKQKTLTYTAEATNRKYDGGTTVEVSLTPTNANGDTVTLTGTGTMDDADAGNGKSVTVTGVTVEGDDAKYYKAADAPTGDVTVNIEKADSAITEAPTANTDLTYTGEAQALVTAGKTEDGEVQYSTDNESYSSDIPTETDADTYSVWYKVKGDKNHNDTEPVEIPNITIAKAEPTATVKANVLTYNGTAQELVTGTTNDGTLKYATEQEGDYEETVPTGTEAKAYEVWYMVEGDGNHEDSTPQKVDNVKINKADSTLAVDGGEVTYGDTLTLTATVAKSPSNLLSINAAVDTVDFYLGETLIKSANVVYEGPFSDTGTATAEVTADKKFAVGANTIRAEYGGSVNLNGSENNSITVTMNQKPLTYNVTATDREYNKTTLVNVTLTPTNNDEDNVTLTAVGNVAAADVDSYQTVNLTEIKVDGEDANYYSVDSSKDNVTLTEAVNITQANGTATVTMNDYKCGDDSVTPLPESDTNGINDVTYTYSVKDANEYVEEKPTKAGEPTEGTEYTVKAVFAETRNYKSVTVTDDFKITHNWDEWTLTDEPTQTEKGAAERNCLSEDNASPDTAVVAELSDDTVWTKGKYVPPTPDKDGSQEYKSEYGTVTETIPKLIVSDLRIISEPTVTTVTEGMTLDVTGLEVEAVYSDTSTANVTHDCKLTYGTSTVGTQTVTVTYGDKKVTFNITVIAKELTGITITKKPDKRLYNKGDSLDTAGMLVTASYNNGTEAQVTDYTTQGYSAQTVGTQTVTVTYGGFTAEFTVTVTETAAPTGTVETPVIETSGYYGGKTVTLTCASADAKIYYTTDGTVPTAASNPYTEPFKVTATTTVKAIAVKDGMEQSRTASGKISVTKAAAPTLSADSGEIEAGTVITLQSDTSGAKIYYTTDGTDPTAENGTLCDGSIVVTEDMTIKAAAVKEGYAWSDVREASYTVKARTAGTADISIGSASGKAGDTLYVPVYIGADSSITDYRFTLTFDNTKLACASISSPDGAAATDIFTSLGENSVTVLYNGSDAVKGGEVCRIAFKALDGAADGECELAVSGAVVITEDAYCDVKTSNGAITLLTPDIKVSADAVFSDEDGNEVDTSSMSGEVDASLTIDEVEGADSPVIANIILAVYDRNGALASMNMMEADLSDTSFIFQKTITIPENVSVGSIKLMIWNGLSDMSPITAASKML